MQGDLQRLDELLVAPERAAVERGVADAVGGAFDHLEQVGQHGGAGEAFIEDAQGRGECGVLAVVRGLSALDADQRRDHRVPAPGGVGEQFTLELGVVAVAEALGGTPGETHVEHVEIPAAAAKADDLTVQRLDHVDVIGFEIAEHERQHAEAGEAEAMRRITVDLPKPSSPITNAVGAVSSPAR